MTYGWEVSANDIKHWSDTNESDAILPELIRRLIVASIPFDKIKQLDFPSEISTTGYDGLLEADVGGPFFPSALSVWESSTQVDVKGKADADYQKRTKSSGGINKKKSEYIAVTSRTWRDKQKWVLEKQKEKKWKSVRAINANDLSTWLSFCHPVHVWFSRLIGKRTGGDSDVDEEWDAWRTATNPVCVSNFIIAGRTEEEQKLVTILKKPALKPIQVISQSIDESFAFILAVLKNQADLAPRVLVVKSQASWDSLISKQEKLVLIPDFSVTKNFGLAISRGHNVIVPKAGNADSTCDLENNDLALSAPNQESLRLALVEMGFTKTEIDTLVIETHDLIGPLRRHPLLHNQNSVVPDWMNKKIYRSVLLVQMFIGIWDSSNQNDCQKISELAGISCEELKSTLHILSGLDDPPVRHINKKWVSLSRHDLWYLLSKYVDQPLLTRFQKIVFDTLEEDDPSYDLKPEDRWLANIYQKNLNNSEEFRSGISDMIAILATYGNTDCKGTEIEFQNFAELIICRLLDHATDRRWYSLKRCLPSLAEASPEFFLNSLDESLKNPNPPVMKLFEPEGQFGHSGHCYLLWALESISWDPKNLSRVMRVLAKLSVHDPGGRYSNGPWNSLIEIFKPEFPQTNAGIHERIKIIDHLVKYESKISWKLLLALLPDFRPGFATPINLPKYRDWAKSWIKGITSHDYQTFSDEIFKRIIITIRSNPNAYWPDAIDLLEKLPSNHLDDLTIQLKSDILVLDNDVKVKIRENVRKIIHSNKKVFGHSNKFLPDTLTTLSQIFRALEPDSLVQKNLFLFDSGYPPISSKKDINEFSAEVEMKRQRTLEKIWKKCNISGIIELTESSQNPVAIGISLAQVSFSGIIEKSVLEWLDNDNKKLSLAARQFIYVKTSLNPKWTSSIVKHNIKSWTSEKKLSFCLSMPPLKTGFAIISSFDKKTQASYWKNVDLPFVDKENECVSYVIKKYLKYSRPIQALRIGGLYFRTVDIEPNLVAEILESIATLKQPKKLLEPENLSGDIIDLLRYLESNRSIPDIRLAKIEMFFMPTYNQNEILPNAVLEESLRKPLFFVDLITMVYKANPPIPGEFSTISEKQRKHRAIVAYSILNLIARLPGQENKSIDSQILNSWVDIARQGCLEKNRQLSGDQSIGRILSYSPLGADEIWPHESVREIFERCESEHLEHGFISGLRDQRGVTMREYLDGGKQERVLFEKYDAWAKSLRPSYPRTSNVIQKIADGYSSNAKDEDKEVDYLKTTR